MNILKRLLLLSFALTIVTQSIATPPKEKLVEPITEEQTKETLKVFFEILKKQNEESVTGKREQAVEDEMLGNTDLHNAIFEHDTEKTKTLLEQNPDDLAVQNKNGNTPLHIALAIVIEEQDGNLEEKQRTVNEIINLLIEKINQQENAEMIFNIQNTFKITPLHVATGTNKIKAITTLLNTNKIQTDIQDVDGYTALLIASKLGFTEIVRLLATEENIYSTNDEGNTSLHLAAKSRSSETVIAILRKAYENQSKNKNILFIKNNWGLIPIQYSDFHADSHKTLTNIHKQTFENLIQSLETESTDEFVQKMKLIKTGDITDVIEISHINTILHLAAHRGHLEKTKAILENFTIDINVRNGSDNTPLHVAILNTKENVLDIVKLLVKNGADINAINSNGNSPLYFAVIPLENNDEIVEFLLTQENVNINHLDINNLRPLHIAVMNHDIVIINKLIKHGAIIDSDVFEAAKQNPTIIRILKRAQKKDQETKSTKATVELSEKEREKNLEDLIGDLEINKNKKDKSKMPNEKKKKPGKKKNKCKSKIGKKSQPKKTQDNIGSRKKEIEDKKKLDQKLEEQAKEKKRLRIKQVQKELSEQKKQKEREERAHQQASADAKDMANKQYEQKRKKLEKQKEKKALRKQKRKKAATQIQKAFRNHQKRKKIYNAIDFAHITHKNNCITQFNELLFAQRFMTGQFFDEKFEDLNYIAKDFKDNNENTALHFFAQSNDHYKYIPVILNHGATINAQNKDGMTPLHSAVYHGNEYAS